MRDSINKMLISGVVYMWGAGAPLVLILHGLYDVSTKVACVGTIFIMLAAFSGGMVKKHRAMQDLDDSIGGQ